MDDVEDLCQYAGLLDQVLAASQNADVVRVVQQFGLKPLDIDPDTETTIHKPDDEVLHDWSISFLNGLPEGYNSPESPTEKLICVLYRVSGRTMPNAFHYNGNLDFWTERIANPCRNLQISVEADPPARVSIQGCEVGLQNMQAKLESESDRCSGFLRRYGRIDYPIETAAYRVDWQMMGSRPRQPQSSNRGAELGSEAGAARG
jgi:hypothetical protein